MSRSSIIEPLGAALGFAACLSSAMAQDSYPSRNVTIVVPLAAGSGTDIMARVLATSLSAKLGKSFTWSSNRPVAMLSPAPNTRRGSRIDGYTMFGGNGTHSAGPHLSREHQIRPDQGLHPDRAGPPLPAPYCWSTR